MEDPISQPAPAVDQCAACDAQILTDDAFCTGCGYPIKGTEKDQKYFMLKREMADIDMNSFNKRLKNAAHSLYYLAGIFVVSGGIFYLLKKDEPDAFSVLITNLVLAFIFLALG
jgi:hypothetical protein